MMADYAAARQNMVESQLRPNGVSDPAIVGAFSAVPRELFVPKPRRSIAYVDEDLLLKDGRYLMEPMVFGKLLQYAGVGRDDLVLDVGAGTGYAAAVLARLGAAVVAVESDPDLAAQATALVGELGIDNVVVVQQPLDAGYPKQAPYDFILIEGAVEDIPPALQAQLAEGGRLATVLRTPGGVGRGTLFTREHGLFSGRPVFDAATPLLPGFARRPGFVF